MAYKGGTIQISPRLLETQLAWLEGHESNVNKAINTAVWDFLHAHQCGKLDYHTQETLVTLGLYNTPNYGQPRQKKSIRLMRQNVEYMRQYGIIVARCLDLAIERYIQKKTAEVQRNNDGKATVL